MTIKNLSTRKRVALVTATAAALLVPASVAGASIESGAGPGWPATLSPSDFVTRVDNPWFPLATGSKWHYRGAKSTPMIDRVRVTDRKKTILGVRVTVVHDEVLVHGRPEEVTNDFYAQDRHGNVWYFGEHTKELNRHGEVTSREGSFKAGRDGARAGLYFPAHPRPGVSARQELFQGHAEDYFEIAERNAHVSVPYVSTDHAVRTKEGTPLEPNVLDNKYYVRGVGTVREIAVKGPKEVLELVSFKKGG